MSGCCIVRPHRQKQTGVYVKVLSMSMVNPRRTNLLPRSFRNNSILSREVGVQSVFFPESGTKPPIPSSIRQRLKASMCFSRTVNSSAAGSSCWAQREIRLVCLTQPNCRPDACAGRLSMEPLLMFRLEIRGRYDRAS